MTTIFEGTSYLQRLKPAERVMPAQDNMQWVLDRKMNYIDAAYRSDIGWVSFLWGREGSNDLSYEDGWGISNILAKAPESEETLLHAVETLSRGKVKRRYGPPGNRRVDITYRGFVVSIAWHRGRKTWYLAGWEGLEAVKENSVLESAKIDKDANKAAESPQNDIPKPTEAQKKSGNYKKGHVKIHGLDISIENPAGSERSGVDRSGKKWTCKINHHYGDIKKTEGKDLDPVDVFLGPDPEGADKVFIVNQVRPDTGKFDEHKCMMGFKTEKEARAAYLSNYMKGWKGIGSMAEMTVDEFKEWLKSGNTKKLAGDVIFESAEDWKAQILNAKTMDDIRVVFDGLFGVSDIGALYNAATHTESNKKLNISYRVVSNGEAERIRENTGLNVAEFSHSVDIFSIRHMNKQHGDIKRESQRGQLPIRREDIESIPNITESPDHIVNGGKTKQGLDSIWYVKRINEYVYYLEEVRTGRKELTAKTMIKGSPGGATSDVPSVVLNRLKPHSQTPEALRPSLENVSSDEAKVKHEVEEPGFTQFSEEMRNKYGGAGWMLGATDEENRKYNDLKESLPDEIREIYKNQYGDTPIVLKMSTKHKDMGAMITPSSKEPGKTQVTYFDQYGFLGDTQFETENDAIRDVYLEGYKEPAPDWLTALQTSKEFIEGNERSQEVQKENARQFLKSKVRDIVSKMRAMVTLEERPKDIPENWIIMNAPRPLVGDKEWQGEFLHGLFYAAIDPGNDEAPGAEWRVNKNNGLDAWVIKYVSDDVIEKYVRKDLERMKYYKDKPEIIEKAMANKDHVRQSFFNSMENKTVVEVETELERIQETIMENTPIYEMAVDPSEIAHSHWEHAIEQAEDMDDISNIFKVLFGGNFENQKSAYLKSTDTSIVMPLDKLVQKETPDPKRLENAYEYMKGAKEGTGEKRPPINVLAMGNGKYKILDGNTTFHALQELGEGKAIVEIKQTLKQPGVETIEDLYKQAEEAQPLFSEFVEKWAKKTGGKAMVRPGLKGRERVIEKATNDEDGQYGNLKDMLAGTLVFESTEDVARAFDMIKDDDSVYRVKNRYEKPMKSGYRDIFMNVAMPNGHIAELQINTQSMINAKEKGLGHKIYDITRTLDPITLKGEGDMRFIARGINEELNDLSLKVYNQAAADSSRSRARASASDLASNSEITDAWDSILDRLSDSVISTQLEESLPSMRKIFQDRRSLTKGTSSFSQNSNDAIDSPQNENNLPDSSSKVKIKGTTGKAFLHDNSSVDIQYAVLDIANVKTSHTDNLSKDENYPQEIQPRQRDRDAMKLQVEEMANRLNPERMGQSPLASSGAPIVGPDLAVESGNGRTIALRKAYSNGEKGREYREWLIQNAAQFGVRPDDVSAIEKPVLVRIRTSDVDDRAKFAEDANKDEIARMSPAEMARMDAENLSDADLALFDPSEDGNLAARSNADFIKKFIQKLGVNEATGYLTEDGRATKQLIDRIQAAVFQKAYNDDSLLALMAEETDPKMRNVLNALTYAAGEFSKCKGFDENLGGINLPSHAIGAMKLIQKSRDDGISIDGMLNQIGMFSEIDESTAAFAKFIDGSIRSGKRMGRVFKEAARILKAHLANEGQETLFGEPPKPTPSEIISIAIQKVEDKYYDGKQKNLFENAETSRNHERSGSDSERGGHRRTGNDLADKGAREMILEKAIPKTAWATDIMAAKSMDDIKTVFAQIFGESDDYEDEKESDYGLKIRGKKAREKINAQVREIIKRVDNPAKLTQEEVGILQQYSGKGGLSDNSQYEYYTPTHVAEGLWDAMKSNGFNNGNILDPSTGAGVFSATKPKGAIITGCDLDPVGSKVAQLLNPDDLIENKPFEQLIVDTENNTFDGVITNVPFGSARGASMHIDPAYKSEKKIERYFILRALDKIKPGRLACFVAPINIVGAKDATFQKWRTVISKKAEFLGAHKLPSKTFGAQGTDTVTDIVVFRKHPQEFLDKVDDLVLETLQETNILWDEFISGEYWKGEGRKFIMGKYTPKIEGDRWSRETVDGDIDNESLKKKLAMRFSSRINWEALEIAEPAEKHHADGDRKIINGSEYEFQNGEWIKVSVEKEESIVLESAKYGAKNISELKSILETPKSSMKLTAKQAFSAYKAFPDLLSPLQQGAVELSQSQPDDAYREQLWRGSIIGGMIGRYANIADDPDNVDAESMRLELQDIVTAEIERYGHPKKNSGLTLTGETSKAFGYFLNTVDEKGNFSDLLATGKNIDRTQYDETNIRSIVEHLYIREGIRTIELEDVQKLYAGTRKIESLADIADDENIAITPDGLIEPISRYAAGDIYEKMRRMTDAMAHEPDEKTKEKYQKQIDLIMSKRKITAIEDISFGMQQKWFGRKYIVDFLRANGYPRASYVTKTTVEREDPVTGEMESNVVHNSDDYDNPNGEFSVGDASGWHKQFGKYLNGKDVTSSKADIKREYQQNVDGLNEQFNVWMMQHQDADQINEKYNQKFNGYLPIEYEETDLGIEGVTEKYKLHTFQNSAIRRLSEEGRGVLAFDVGLGKTLTSLALHAYNKQMGRTKKTCVVVPNAVLSNWYRSAKKYFGTMDDCIFVGFEPKLNKDGNIVQELVKDEDGNPKRNKNTDEIEYQDKLIKRDSKADVWEKMWEIPGSHKSLVMMSKEKFGTIPMRPSSKRNFTDKMVQHALIKENKADEVVNNSESKGRSYSEDVQQQQLEGKFSDEGTIKKDELPYFEDMGFTNVITDEIHEFKNSYEPGKQTQRYAYLPTAPSAKRSLDMAMKMHNLRESNGGRGVYALSATPVTNSPFEIYNILSLCCPPEEFERFGIHTVDDFVRVFGQIETVDKVKVSGEIKPMLGLTGFQNLDGLRNLFHKYVNMKNANDVKESFELPPYDEINDIVELTAKQETVYEDLRERAEAAAKPKLMGGSGESLFRVMRDMDRVTTDMDLYNKAMTFHFSAQNQDKAMEVAAKLEGDSMTRNEIDEDGDKIVVDVPFKAETSISNDTFIMKIPQEFEEVFVSKFPEVGIEHEDVGHPITPKYAKLIERLKTHHEAKGKQIVFTDEKSQHNKIQRMITHEMPILKDVIGIINADTASGNKMQKISDKYNTGKFKIVIANKKAEVGVNLQKGTTAIHHLTLPWTPASIQQRNGRGVRQGNKAAHISIYYYLGKGSFDEYRLDLLKRKSNWMHDLFTGHDTTAENANAENTDDYLDMLAANPEEAQQRRMERLAAEQARRRARDNLIAANNLQQLANNQSLLGTLDARKEAEREKLTAQVAEYQQTYDNYTERIEKETDKPKKTDLKNKQTKKKWQIDKAQDRLAALDDLYENSKKDLEAKSKQVSGILKQRAKKGKLAFDETLIDHPLDALVSLKGEVLAKGDYYEVADTLPEDPPVALIKIERIFQAGTTKVVDYEEITGRYFLHKEVLLDENGERYKWPGSEDWVVGVPFGTWPFDRMTKVSYSDEEIQLKKLLDKEINGLSDLFLRNIGKDIFLDHINEINFKKRGTFIFRSDNEFKAGDLEDNERENMVYPEPDDADFKKNLCELYLRYDRDGKGYQLAMHMANIFGDNYQAIAMEYGKTATEKEIREKLAEVYANFEAEKLQTTGISEYDIYISTLNGSVPVIRDKVAEGLGGIDNMTDVRTTVTQFISSKIDEIYKKMQQLREEAEQKELEAIKTHPDYREVPADLKEAFEAMGITVKTNMTNMVIPGFKGRKGIPVEPFQKWYFQDEAGYHGRLREVSKIMKSRYKASFFKDADDNFTGAWWHVPIKTSLREVYELMEV